MRKTAIPNHVDSDSDQTGIIASWIDLNASEIASILKKEILIFGK